MSEGTVSPPRGRGLGARLLVAQTLVLLAGAVTSWLVASAVAPGIFHDHLQQAGVSHSAAEAVHVEEAFADSLVLAFGVALVTSVLVALAVTGYLTRRVQRSTAAVSHAAAEIAAGHYDSRVPEPGLGAEFALLSSTVNELAERLGDVETTRRRILADLAHEMRTPLATIEAHLEALEDGVRRLDDATLAVLHEATQRLQRLAEDVSAVSHAEEGRLESRPVVVAPAALLTAATAAAADAFRAKGVDLDLDATAPTPPVLVDPQRMAQVVGNLLDNALRHTPPGGHVHLTLRRADDRWVELEVRDDGEGIAAEHLPHVFERFYRADPARGRAPGGSGIGLTISRALVEAHGGGLSARSAGPDTGATFTIRLPAASPGSASGNKP
ncbi:MAG TPA: HAMP domain-containing sensor histidine kinase [Ornithinibacter sp.]|nr:HAMP domain-containing sensor histidine kinase [Ornithinibacter sp.]